MARINDADVLCVRHEFSIYGGSYGSHEAFRITQDKVWQSEMKFAFEWFFGRYDLGLCHYDYHTGSCGYGLNADGVSIKQGTKSTLAFQLALVEMNCSEHWVTLYPIL